MRTQAGTQKLIIQQENNTNENKENHIISQSVDGISYQKQRNKLRKVNDIQKCQQHLQNLKKKKQK